MPIAEIGVSLGGVAAIAFLAWFFFELKQMQTPRLKEIPHCKLFRVICAWSRN